LVNSRMRSRHHPFKCNYKSHRGGNSYTVLVAVAVLPVAVAVVIVLEAATVAIVVIVAVVRRSSGRSNGSYSGCST